MWVADLAYLRCWEGVVFFAFVLDAFSRRVVGLQLARICARRSCSTRCGWRSASAGPARRRPGAPLRPRLAIHQLDYTETLADHGVLASVGSVRDAHDNALAESFVDSFKTELITDRVWRTRSQLELAVLEYIGWFNHTRLHEALGDIPPAE